MDVKRSENNLPILLPALRLYYESQFEKSIFKTLRTKKSLSFLSLTAWMWNNKPMRPLFSEPLTLLLPSIWYSDELYYIFHAPGSHISKTEAKELSKLPSYVYQNQFRQELSRWGHSTYNRAQAIWEKKGKRIRHKSPHYPPPDPWLFMPLRDSHYNVE